MYYITLCINVLCMGGTKEREGQRKGREREGDGRERGRKEDGERERERELVHVFVNNAQPLPCSSLPYCHLLK